MNILILGDVFGQSGKLAIKNELSKLRQQYQIDLVIANCENVTNCRGLSYDDYCFLINNNVDFITMGNHTWKQDDYIKVLNQPQIIRPLNIDESSIYSKIGFGYKVINVYDKKICIINILSKSIILKNIPLTNPYNAVLNLINNLSDIDIFIVDFHADTTSEKYAALKIFAPYVQIIIGTHSHVQTNDARIENNTAYITDVGMCGPYEGIIGADQNSLIEMFLEKNSHFRLTEASGKYQLNGVLINLDDNIPKNIKTINLIEN